MRLYALAVLALLVLAASPAGAQHRRPGEAEPSHADAEIAFARGLAAFHRGELEAAAERFADAVEHYPDNGNARYRLGVTLLKLGKPAAAVDQIARSLRARQPPRTERWRVLAHLGAAKRAAGDPRGAERRFKKAEARGGEEARRAVERLRGLAPAAIPGEVEDPLYRGPFWPPERPLRWEGRLGFAGGEDSNPHILDDELILNDPDGALVRGSEADRVRELRLFAAHYPFYDRRGWSLGMTFQASRSLHQEFDELDMGVAHAAVHLARGADPVGYLRGPLGYTRVPYGNDRFSLLLQLGYLTSRLDGDTYARGAEAAATLVFRQSHVTATQVELGYRDRDYREASFEHRDRSGARLSFEVSQYFFLKRRDRYLRLGLGAVDRDAGRAYARTVLGARAEAALPLRRRWSLLASASLRREEYEFPESNLFSALPAGLEPRRDDIFEAAANLVWSFRPKLKLVAAVSLSDRDAELELVPGIASALDYRRTRSSLSVSWFVDRGTFSRRWSP